MTQMQLFQIAPVWQSLKKVLRDYVCPAASSSVPAASSRSRFDLLDVKAVVRIIYSPVH